MWVRKACKHPGPSVPVPGFSQCQAPLPSCQILVCVTAGYLCPPRGLEPSFPPAGVCSSYWVRKYWRQLTRQRLALAEEMVLYLVIFGFFPGMLAHFSPHALIRSSGLRREHSQCWDFGERRRRQEDDVRFFSWRH